MTWAICTPTRLGNQPFAKALCTAIVGTALFGVVFGVSCLTGLGFLLDVCDWMGPGDSAVTCIVSQLGAIRIAVFDGSPLFRAGIVHTLNAEPDMEVVLESDSGSGTHHLGAGVALDIAVLDADLMEADKNLWHSIIRVCPASRILVMAQSSDQGKILATFAAGARGYILKGVTKHDFLAAIRALYRDEGYVLPALGAAMLVNV